MKKKITILITFLIIISNIHGQPPAIWQLLQDGTINRYAYSGGDEFNGTSLDNSKWINSFPWGRNYEGTCNQAYATDGLNFEFENGILKLITKKEDLYARGVPYESDNYLLQDGGVNLRWWHYTTGMIFSKQKFKYGIYEIKFKLPAGKGFWPAFWLFGGNPNEEFDIFEYKGETPNKIHIDMHCPDGCGNFGDWYTATGNFSDGFNDMMGEWDPNMSFWSLNGLDFAIWLGNLNYQAHIIAGTGVANESPCTFSPGPDNSTPFPSAFEIDFIRVWTRLDCQQVINICNYNQTITDPTVITGNSITIGGSNCNSTLKNGEYLKLIATDYILLEQGFNTENGSNLSTNIVDCPGPETKMTNYQNQSDSSLHIISTIEPDNNNLSNKNVYASIENPPLLYTKIYPNPTEGKITIEFVGKIEQYIKIELISSTGQLVFSKEHILEKNINIDISKLPKGSYFLKGTFGNNTISDKIILN